MFKMAYIIKIDDGIFLSNWQGAANRDFLEDFGIQRIISLGNEEEQNFYVYHEDMDYLKIIINDDEVSNISQYFQKTNEFITRSNVLIHCNKGISRSATIVISYLMSLGYSFEESINKIKKKVKPNPSFEKQLFDFY
tara:strand:+ start:1876 stop:2286 length:411 start_codon:yes stop_codon:yes gene_type:complete